MGRASSLLAAGVVALALAPAAAAAPCTLWAHPGGNDRAEGTPRAPLRSITRMLARLGAGQTGCLAPGVTYREAVQVTRGGSPGRPLRLQGNGAVLQGGVAVRASDVVVAGLRIRGLGERRRGIVVVQAARVAILRNEIVGRDIVRWTPCVLLDRAEGTTIDGNVVSECTRATSRSVSAQGIFVVGSVGTTIANNVVTRTSGEGIAFTNSSRAVVLRNHVHANTNGVYLGPGTSEVVVAENVISYSGRHNVHGGGGSGNLVTANCLWRGFGGNVAGGGFATAGNLVTSPRYVNRFRSLAMRRGPCAALRPSSRRSAGASVGTPYPILPRFRVHYRLLGLPGRVRVVRLAVSRVLPGTPLRVRCLRGCRVAVRAVAGADGGASFGALRGRWLGRGAVLELRAARPGWGGHVARVRVVGAPRGVRIAHACARPGSAAAVSCTRLHRR